MTLGMVVEAVAASGFRRPVVLLSSGSFAALSRALGVSSGLRPVGSEIFNLLGASVIREVPGQTVPIQVEPFGGVLPSGPPLFPVEQGS